MKKNTQTVQLSTKDKNYDGNNNTQFKAATIDVTQLEQTVKSTNYSAIQWKDGKRVGENFVLATGFIVDIDEKNNITIVEATKRLKKHHLKIILMAVADV